MARFLGVLCGAMMDMSVESRQEKQEYAAALSAVVGKASKVSVSWHLALTLAVFSGGTAATTSSKSTAGPSYWNFFEVGLL